MNINEIPLTGLVYRFTIGDYHYTGSTCQTIQHRYKTHLTSYKKHCLLGNTRRVYEYIRTVEGEWDSVKVSILERDIPVEKLAMKEQSYINKDDPFCLNTYNTVAPVVRVVLKANRTPRKKQYDVKYYEEHKERIKQQRRERWEKDRQDPERYARHLKQSREAQARYQSKKKESVDV
jgi:hypothetical protein